MSECNKIKFPGYARNKVMWTIDNFKPEVLKNSRFYSHESPPFIVWMNNDIRSLKWKLRIDRNQTCISLNLQAASPNGKFEEFQDLSIAYECGLLDHIDSSLSHKSQGNLKKFWYSKKMGKLINYKELNAHKWQLLKNNKLTIVVHFDIIEDMKLPLGLNDMSLQFEKLFTNEKFSDFDLITSEERKIPVHKNIMSIRSPVFETMMETKMRESKENKATIDDIGDKALYEFLRFVYCGRVEGIDEVAVELLYAASKYDVPDLKPMCVESLSKNLTLENVIETLILADLHSETDLKTYCIDFVKWNYSDLKKSEVWESVPSRVYKEILDFVLSTSRSDDSVIKIKSDIVSSSPSNVQVQANVTHA